MIKKASEYANKRHSGQLYSESKPYYFHLEEVVSLVKSFSLNEDLIVSAYLHDVIEDCFGNPEEGFEDIKKEFGIKVANIVWNVSGFGNNRLEKANNIIEKIATDEDSINIKICDRICNLKNLLGNEKKTKMYLKEVPLYEEVFSKAHPDLFSLYKETIQSLHDYKSKKKLNI